MTLPLLAIAADGGRAAGKLFEIIGRVFGLEILIVVLIVVVVVGIYLFVRDRS